MKYVVPLAAIFCLTAPLFSQELARDALRELTFEEQDDRVLEHLLALHGQARHAAHFEATVDRWLADLDPADTANTRQRIDALLRETPETDLYGALFALIQHRSQTESRRKGFGALPVTVAAASTEEEEEEQEEEEEDDGKDEWGCWPFESYIGGQCCEGSNNPGDCRDPATTIADRHQP